MAEQHLKRILLSDVAKVSMFIVFLYKYIFLLFLHLYFVWTVDRQEAKFGEPGFELGTPKAQRHYMSAFCPQGY